MTRYHVWTDGSAISDQSMRANGHRYPGGWAAIVEHGSDGIALRGREANTTNTRMELRAVIEGLAAVPVGYPVTIHFDCTTVFSVLDRWERGVLAALVVIGKPDADLWVDLGAQFDRVAPSGLTTSLVTGYSPIHRRAHSIAQAEAKSQARGLRPDMTILSRIEKKERRRAAMLQHQLDCSPSHCVTDCPVTVAARLRR